MVEEYIEVLEKFLGTKRTILAWLRDGNNVHQRKRQEMVNRSILDLYLFPSMLVALANTPQRVFLTQCYEYSHIFEPYSRE